MHRTHSYCGKQAEAAEELISPTWAPGQRLLNQPGSGLYQPLGSGNFNSGPGQRLGNQPGSGMHQLAPSGSLNPGTPKLGAGESCCNSFQHHSSRVCWVPC